MIYYSASTGGFYDCAIHESKPIDAVEITAEQHAALLKGQSEGKVIAVDSSGNPTLQDRPPYVPSADEVRAKRQATYRLESDPLKIEAEHDALVAGTETDYTTWLAKVAEIKERYPLP